VANDSARNTADDAETSGAGSANVRLLMDGSPEGIVITRDAHFVYTNPAALRTLGYRDEQELFWRPVSTIVHANDRRSIEEHLASPVEPPKRPPQHELRMLRRTGHVVTVMTSFMRIDFEGQPAVVMYMRDITEARRLEKQLQFTDRMASVGTLAAGVAHEINNPLTYVLANLDLIDDELQIRAEIVGAKGLAEFRELIDEAREGAFRVRSIVRELRVFARPDEQKVVPVDLQQTIESVSKMAMNEIRHRARFITDFTPTPNVHANPNHLSQVILNLLVNAAHAIPTGNVDANEVRVRTGVDASGLVMVEVTDTGVGIGFDILDRIFDPFFTTKDPGVGTGLGLSICHSLITAMGGQIKVDSIVDEGTTFRVMLPSSDET